MSNEYILVRSVFRSACTESVKMFFLFYANTIGLITIQNSFDIHTSALTFSFNLIRWICIIIFSVLLAAFHIIFVNWIEHLIQMIPGQVVNLVIHLNCEYLVQMISNEFVYHDNGIHVTHLIVCIETSIHDAHLFALFKSIDLCINCLFVSVSFCVACEMEMCLCGNPVLKIASKQTCEILFKPAWHSIQSYFFFKGIECETISLNLIFWIQFEASTTKVNVWFSICLLNVKYFVCLPFTYYFNQYSSLVVMEYVCKQW